MTSYKSQMEAGLPPGPLGDEPADYRDYLVLGIAWGLLLGLALIDFCETLRVCQ